MYLANLGFQGLLEHGTGATARIGQGFCMANWYHRKPA